jgi:hypothetical protein
MPIKGQCYRWSEVPGNGDGFLRQGDGQIVSAALHCDLNPDAPEIILVGRGSRRESLAKLLCEQQLPFGVYLKRDVNRWEFSGDFVVDQWSENPTEIRKQNARSNRNNVVRIIYLRPDRRS